MPDIFASRLEYLLEHQGRDRQARHYGVTERTVRNWAAGRTRPSARIQESIVRRGRYAGALPTIQRRENGRFTTRGSITSDRALRAIESENQRRRVDRNRAIKAAETEAQLQDAESRLGYVTEAEETDIDAVLERREYLEDWEWDEWRDDLVRVGYIGGD